MQNENELQNTDLLQETPAEEVPVEEIPVEEVPIEEPPVEDAPVEEIPVEEPPVEDAPVEETPVVEAPVAEVPAEKPTTPAKRPVKIRRRRPWPLKILLGLVAFALCIVMFVVTIAGTVIVDLRVMTSQGGIQQIITSLLVPAKPSASIKTPQPRLSLDFEIDDSQQNLTGPLVDMIYDALKDSMMAELEMTKEDLSAFLEKSTVDEFLSEKLSGAVDDLLNETSNTTITRQDVMDLIQENKPLLEETLDVEITDDMINDIEESLESVEVFDKLEENGFVGILEDAVGDAGMGAMTEGVSAVRQIMSYVRLITSDLAIACIAGVFLLLFGLLWLTNFTVPKTLSDTGLVLTFAGLLLSAPVIVADSGLLASALSGQAAVVGILSGIFAAIGPVHYAVLGAGVLLIVLAIVAKIIKNARIKKALAAAV